MPSSIWIRIVIFVAALFWFGATLVMEIPVGERWVRPLGLAASATVAGILAFDRYLWRLLPQSVVKHPKVRGTWKATLEYEWPSGTRKTKDCYLVIQQTFSQLSVVGLFDISRSRSTAADITKTDGSYELWYVYWSEANPLERGGNPPHRGAMNLTVSFHPRIALEGQYWTDRKTVGLVRTSGHSKKLFNSYSTAERGSYS